MTGVQTIRDIYEGLQSSPGEPTLVNSLRRDIYGHPFSDVLSVSGPARSRARRCRPQELGAGRRRAAIRSAREFDQRPVSMNLHHPAVVDGPEKFDAVTVHQGAIATAAAISDTRASTLGPEASSYLTPDLPSPDRYGD